MYKAWSIGWMFFLFVFCGMNAEAQGESISLETALPIGSEMRMEVNGEGKLSFDGLVKLREEEQQGIVFTIFRVEKQTCTLKGKVRGLDCSNQQVTRLDLSQAVGLKTLFAFKNRIESIDLSAARGLVFVDLSFNRLKEVALTHFLELKNLALYNNQLTALKVEDCPKLSYVGLHQNRLPEDVFLSLSKTLPEVKGGVLVVVNGLGEDNNQCSKTAVNLFKKSGWGVYDYNGNPFAMLSFEGYDYVPVVSDRKIILESDLPKGTPISLKMKSTKPLKIEGIDSVSCETSFDGVRTYQLNIREAQWAIRGDVELLDCSELGLRSLHFATEAVLTHLICRNNQITELDLRGCKQLRQLNCAHNRIAKLLLCEEAPLDTWVVCGNLIGAEEAVQIAEKVSTSVGAERKAILFSETEADGNRFSPQSVETLGRKGFKSFAVVDAESHLKYYKGFGYIPKVSDKAQVKFVTNHSVGDSLLIEITPYGTEDVSVEGATFLYLDAPFDSPYGVYRLNGQEVTIKGNVERLDLGECALKKLDCSQASTLSTLLLVGNPLLTELDVQRNTALKVLQIVRCGIATLNTRPLSELTHYYAGYSALREVDLSQNKRLRVLNVDRLQLREIDVSKNIELEQLSCSENQLVRLSLEHNRNLTEVYCADNLLEEIVLPPASPLKKLDVARNRLTELALGEVPYLEWLFCHSNRIDEQRARSLLMALPNRSIGVAGRLFFRNGKDPKEGNKAYKKHVSAASGNHWLILDFNGNQGRAKKYEGEPDPEGSDEVVLDGLSVGWNGRVLEIKGVPPDSLVGVYSASGEMVARQVSFGEVVTIDLSGCLRGELLLVRTQSRSFKIMVQ